MELETPIWCTYYYASASLRCIILAFERLLFCTYFYFAAVERICVVRSGFVCCAHATIIAQIMLINMLLLSHVAWVSQCPVTGDTTGACALLSVVTEND